MVFAWFEALFLLEGPKTLKFDSKLLESSAKLWEANSKLLESDSKLLERDSKLWQDVLRMLSNNNNYYNISADAPGRRCGEGF